MKQVLQNVRKNQPVVKDVPPPQCGAGEVLVETEASLISAGTEKMLIDFAGKSFVGKAKERPDLAKKVLTKLQRDGLVPTVRSVWAQLEKPLPLGYSAAGKVVEVGAKLASEFQVGERVVIAGAGLANHAQLNAVPRNLVVKAPTSADPQHLCFGTLGAIALHGVHNAELTLGDRVVVMGLGLVGQLAAQLASLSGAQVLGVDYAQDRLDLSKETGACAAIANPATQDVSAIVQQFTNGRGADAILICAATDSAEPINNAAAWARDRAKVVLVGKVGTEIPYADYMKKELTVRISRSYGPGRYDPNFENAGQNYPVGYVPHTERDNLAHITNLISNGKLNIAPLLTHTFSINEADQAYALLEQGVPCLGVVLTYPQNESHQSRIQLQPTPLGVNKVGVASLGAGAFASSVLLPALQQQQNAILTGVVSKGGTTAQAVGERFGFSYATSNLEDVLADTATHAVIISTRHNTHASFVEQCLKAGKHVFVEKPLALTLNELESIEKTYKKHPNCLLVGFNRRFSPMTQALQTKLKGLGPRQILIRVNAGQLPQDNWQSDSQIGGGRLLGEVCHFTDLAYALAQNDQNNETENAPTQIYATQGQGQDNYAITINFTDGSIAQIFYTSDGDTSQSKERIEVYAGESVGIIDNFTSASFTTRGKMKSLGKTNLLTGQNKGHAAELDAFLEACKSGQLPIPFGQLITSSKLTLLAKQSITAGTPLSLA